MKKLLKSGTTIISTVMLLSACTASDMQSITGSGEAIPTASTKHTAIPEQKVKIYYSNVGIPKHYEVIGRVSTSNDNMMGVPHSQQTISDNLKKQAASIGANGIINIQTTFEKTTGDAILKR